MHSTVICLLCTLRDTGTVLCLFGIALGGWRWRVVKVEGRVGLGVGWRCRQVGAAC